MTTPTQPSPAEQWFLARGLPAVLRRGALLRRPWVRSAPALAGFAVLAVNSILVVLLTGKHTVDIVGRPDLKEGLVLVLAVLVLPVAAVVGWLVSRLTTMPRRKTAVYVSLAVACLGVLFGGPGNRVLVNAALAIVAVAAVLAMTASGAGSVLGWAAHATLTNLRSVGSMFVRTLPVLLLTFLVFFNAHVWVMAAVISRTRLWLAIGFLFLIAATFLVSSTLDRVKPVLAEPHSPVEDGARLTGTPFEHIADNGRAYPLSRAERVNVAFVVGVSELVQVLTVAVMTGAIFFGLGLVLLSPRLLELWTRGTGRADGEVLGMTLPVPDSLIQTSMMLSAITFMYLSARAVTDKEYRVQFLDPLLDDLQVTLVARDRYRASLQARWER